MGKLTNLINFQECDIADEHVLKDYCADDLHWSPRAPRDFPLRHSDPCSAEKLPQSESLDQLHGRLVEADVEIEFLRARVAQLENFSMSNERMPNCDPKKETKVTNDEENVGSHATQYPAAASGIASLWRENAALRFQVAELHAEFERGLVHVPRDESSR